MGRAQERAISTRFHLCSPQCKNSSVSSWNQHEVRLMSLSSSMRSERRRIDVWGVTVTSNDNLASGLATTHGKASEYLTAPTHWTGRRNLEDGLNGYTYMEDRR